MTDAVIRRATAADAPRLPEVERSAGELFRSIDDLAWLADDTVLSAEEHQTWARAGSSWVAEETDGPIGFLVAEVAGDELHVWELAVRVDRQGQGIGRRLLGAAREAAGEQGLTAVTLTTFSDVPWNAPFYQRLGFEQLEDGAAGPRLTEILCQERARGLPRRCAMRLPLVGRGENLSCST